jgi:hypothetical protein
MSRTRFIDLANEFCALNNVAQPKLLVECHPIEVEGVDFFLQYDEQFSPEHLVVYCDFGLPPAERLLDAYRALLETNMIVYGAGSPAFMLGPDKRVLFGYHCRLMELKAPQLLDIFVNLAAQARDWRTGHFLQA